MKIQFSSCCVKFLVCPGSRTNFICNLKHFSSMSLMSSCDSLPSSGASMISNNSLLIASEFFWTASKGSLQLLGFLYRPHHHNHPNRDVEDISRISLRHLQRMSKEVVLHAKPKKLYPSAQH
ncbi:uncharacterized protein LOC102609225 isoform X2 [Citrus sinensis]|nr:uncharacterized protein LOC102609225 isoform X2 [Citrus sinensis]XP_024042447.1 uncharacterized protein LOC112099304 isoform X2 [Citrus x clementina]